MNRAENARRMGLANFRDGLRNKPEWQCWRAMIDRCYNPKNRAFKNYGGRGIRVCRRWRNSFETFYLDMGKRPPSYTLERVKNYRGYSPANCEWRTRTAQNQNRRNTVFVEYRGERRQLSAIVSRASGDYGRAWRRIFKFGWSVDRAVGTPSRAHAANQSN